MQFSHRRVAERQMQAAAAHCHALAGRFGRLGPARQTEPAVLQGWEPFAFLAPCLSLTLFQSLASMTYLINRNGIYIYICMCHLFFFLICSPPAKITFKWMRPRWPHVVTGNTTIHGSSESLAPDLPSLSSFYRGTVFHVVWQILECFELPLLESKKAILQTGQKTGCILFLCKKTISTECNRFRASGNLKVSLHFRSKRIFPAESASIRSLKWVTTSYVAWQNDIKTCWFK